MKAQTYNQSGKEAGTIDLPDAVFSVPWNADLVHQVVTAMQANARSPWAHTKDRGDVRGGGAKPWRQKGTGRARHGSTRSPIWRGGGVTFGPRNEKNYAQKINKKMRSAALAATLSAKLRDGEIIFLDTLSFSSPKTADALGTLRALSRLDGFDGLITRKRNSIFLAFGSENANAAKSFRNFRTILVGDVRNMNPVDVLRYKYLIVTDPEKAVSFLHSRSGAKKRKTEKIKA